jgi:hypothetical protein
MNAARRGAWVGAVAMSVVCSGVFAQQARVQYTWEWSEVLANSATPSVATPGVIDPTEGVRLTLHALMTPDVGQSVTYVPPPIGPGTGTVYCWGGNDTILRGGPASEGVFSLPVAANGFLAESFLALSSTELLFGVVNDSILGSLPTNTSNPVQGLISFTWTPAVYSPRTVSFSSEDPLGGGSANQMLVRYGTGPTGAPLLTATGAIANHGPGTGGIPIVPGPGAAVVLVMGLAGWRRRRQMSKLANWHMST